MLDKDASVKLSQNRRIIQSVFCAILFLKKSFRSYGYASPKISGCLT